MEMTRRRGLISLESGWRRGNSEFQITDYYGLVHLRLGWCEFDIEGKKEHVYSLVGSSFPHDSVYEEMSGTYNALALNQLVCVDGR